MKIDFSIGKIPRLNFERYVTPYKSGYFPQRKINFHKSNLPRLNERQTNYCAFAVAQHYLRHGPRECYISVTP